MSNPSYQVVIKFYGVRINQPGFGPRIVAALMSDLAAGDLSAQPCLFWGAGAPSDSTLLPGNGAYIVGDEYTDVQGNAKYFCSTAGTNETSAWTQISGGASGNWNYRGTWTSSPASPYMTFDVVQMGTGTASGMYLSLADNNPYEPDIGPNWVQVSSSSGAWL